MSDPDRPITESELQPLLKALSQFLDGSAPAFQALFDQTRANTVVCTLLLREMTQAGLVDADALKREALTVAESLQPSGSGRGVAKVIASIFGGELAEVPPQVVLRVIQGGLTLNFGDQKSATGDEFAETK